ARSAQPRRARGGADRRRRARRRMTQKVSRLPTHLEVASILRRTAASGDFATVMRKGDAERGSLLIFVSSRGRHVAILERVLGIDSEYRWQVSNAVDSA